MKPAEKRVSFCFGGGGMSNDTNYDWLSSGRYIFFSNFNGHWYGNDTTGKYFGSEVVAIGQSLLPTELTPQKDIENTDINI